MSGEGCVGILKGLLGFQKRMRMAEVYGDQGQLCGNTQECAEKMKADLYMEALEEAIRCVEAVHGIGSKIKDYEAWKTEWLKNHGTVLEAVPWARDHVNSDYAKKLERIIQEMEDPAEGHGQ